MDLASGDKRYLTEDFDYSPSGPVWADEGKTLFLWQVSNRPFSCLKWMCPTTEIRPLPAGMHDYHSVALAGDKLIATRVDMTKPEEIYSVDPVNRRSHRTLL